MTLLPTETEQIAKSLADLADRVKKLEALQRMDLGSSALTVSSQTIPHAAGTPLAFMVGNMGGGFSWDLLNPTKIYCTWARQTVRCCIFGYVSWGFSANGWRGINIAKYTGGGVLDGVYTVVAHDANSSASTNQSFCTWYSPDDELHYFEVSVTQTSGGPLDVDFALIGMFVTK